MAVVSTYLAVWNRTSTRSPDGRYSFTPTRKQRRLPWGLKCSNVDLETFLCRLHNRFFIHSTMGLMVVGFSWDFYQAHAGVLGSPKCPRVSGTKHKIAHLGGEIRPPCLHVTVVEMTALSKNSAVVSDYLQSVCFFSTTPFRSC